MNSTHRVDIVPVKLEPHPNADSLSLVHIDGYTVVVRTEDWQDKEIGAYIPPDNIVPDTEEYAFLKGKRRIKAHKFRGIVSHGLLVQAPEGYKIGDDVAEALGVIHYVPPEPDSVDTRGSKAPDPFPWIPKYDIESWRKFGKLLHEGEDVIITEKIHGCNCRYSYFEGEFHCGSRNEWKKNDGNVWWKILNENEWLRNVLQQLEGHVIYGEVYGWVQDLRYGHKAGEVSFRIFDIYDGKEKYLDNYDLSNLPIDLQDLLVSNWVPCLYTGQYTEAKCLELYQGKSLLGDNMREGIVIKPVVERWHPRMGRVILKLVSDEYLMRAD